MKFAVVEALVAQLNAELIALTAVAKTAREAATHEESKPEDQYDTRGLEASYLAGAQAERLVQLQGQIALFQSLPVREAKPGSSIELGSLVELQDTRGKRFWYLLVAQGGGHSTVVDGRTVQVITPESPLGDSILGRKAGEAVEVELQETTREYTVLSVT